MSSHLLLYILKRILVMVPTLFVIVLVCFLVLNFAPGKPGKAGEAAQAAGSEEARAQYRIFKETFNYDKPVLFNTYFWVERDEVLGLMETSISPSADPKDKIEAQNQLEDYGEYIVPHLIEIASQVDDFELKRLAFYQLSINGQKRNLFLGRESDVPAAIKAEQREIGRHDHQVSKWTLPEKATAEEQARLLATWREWFDTNQERFNWSSGERFSRFFTDTRFYKYMSNVIVGDLGFTIKKEPVLPEILKRVKYSFTLSMLSIFLVYLLSIPIGIFSAMRQRTAADQVMTVVLFILYSLPTFFVGTLIVQYIPNGEPLFTSGFETSVVANPNLTTGARLWDMVLHLILPVFCLTYGGLAALSRYARSGLLDVIRADYIRTARAKGLPEGIVVFKHALRNGMIPILTILGTLLPVLFGGSIVIEYIFEIDGIGRYLLQAIQLRDYTVIMGILLISAVMTLCGLLISDISYALVDPRITFD